MTAGNACRGGLRLVAASIAERMSRDVRAQTDEALTAQFGISYNTWCKIRSGQPIRASVATRVERRYE